MMRVRPGAAPVRAPARTVACPAPWAPGRAWVAAASTVPAPRRALMARPGKACGTALRAGHVPEEAQRPPSTPRRRPSPPPSPACGRGSEESATPRKRRDEADHTSAANVNHRAASATRQTAMTDAQAGLPKGVGSTHRSGPDPATQPLAAIRKTTCRWIHHGGMGLSTDRQKLTRAPSVTLRPRRGAASLMKEVWAKASLSVTLSARR